MARSVYDKKLKPFRDIDEHDVVNLFTYTGANLSQGSTVSIVGNGFVSTDYGPVIDSNTSVAPDKSFSPRWAVKAKVGLAATGVSAKCFGVTLVDVKEKGQFDRPYVFYPNIAAEDEAVVSGQAIPILRKGLLLYKVGTGIACVGSGAVVGDDGFVKVGSAKNIGEFLGNPDKDGYALLSLNCY